MWVNKKLDYILIVPRIYQYFFLRRCSHRRQNNKCKKYYYIPCYSYSF